MSSRALPLLVSAAAGALAVFAFAPFRVTGLALAALTLLLWLWQRAETPRDAAWTGFAFGVGLFGAGASWLYIAIETFGGMPPWLAFLAIAVLVVYLSLWPAAAGFLATRIRAAAMAPSSRRGVSAAKGPRCAARPVEGMVMNHHTPSGSNLKLVSASSWWGKPRKMSSVPKPTL